MAIKTTGIEFKLFYDDPKFWPEGAWHDDTVFHVDGVKQEELDTTKIADTAKVEIEAGYVFLSTEDSDGVDLLTHFRRWMKQQKSRFLVIEVDAGNLEAVTAAIKASGGRIR